MDGERLLIREDRDMPINDIRHALTIAKNTNKLITPIAHRTAEIKEITTEKRGLTTISDSTDMIEPAKVLIIQKNFLVFANMSWILSYLFLVSS